MACFKSMYSMYIKLNEDILFVATPLKTRKFSHVGFSLLNVFKLRFFRHVVCKNLIKFLNADIFLVLNAARYLASKAPVIHKFRLNSKIFYHK